MLHMASSENVAGHWMSSLKTWAEGQHQLGEVKWIKRAYLQSVLSVV
jgi:hypothetical protein